jgi:acyl-ACP thioesterase
MDAGGKISIQSLCNYLQEMAGLHAAELGVSVTDLFKKNLTWVLSRLHVIIDHYPSWGDYVTIDTWPSGAEGLYAIRDFYIIDSADKMIGRAISSWMIIDLVKKKPIEMPKFVHDLRLTGKERAIEDHFPKLPKISEINFEKQFNVRRSDLDINQHVNNVNYIEWAVESVPGEIYNSKVLKELEINFRAESTYGDRIIAQSQVQNDTCFHKLTRSDDNRELAIVRTRWNSK